MHLRLKQTWHHEKMIKYFRKLRCVRINQSYPFMVNIFGKCFSCFFRTTWIISLSCGASFDVFNARWICYCKILTTMQVLNCYSLTIFEELVVLATPLIFILYKKVIGEPTYVWITRIQSFQLFDFLFQHWKMFFVQSEHDAKRVWKWIK